MDRIYHSLAQHWHLTQAQYTQLHLLSSVMLGPLLGVIVVILLLLRRKKKQTEAAS